MTTFAVRLAEVQRLRQRGRHSAAYTAAVRLLASRVDAASAVALVRNELGLLLKAAGAYQAAREQYELAMRQLLAGAYAGDSDEAATLLHNLAGIRFVLGDPAGAARCGRRGLAMRQRLRGPDALAVLLDEGNLAPILVALGDVDAAQRMLDRLLAVFTTRLGPADTEVAVTLGNLGALAAHRQDWPTACRQLARALQVKEMRFGADSHELIGTLANLAVATARLGAAGAADAMVERARRIARTALPTGHPLRQHVERLRPVQPESRPSGW